MPTPNREKAEEDDDDVRMSKLTTCWKVIKYYIILVVARPTCVVGYSVAYCRYPVNIITIKNNHRSIS